jgi:hypothetical protein
MGLSSHSVKSNEIASYLYSFDQPLSHNLARQGNLLAALVEPGIKLGVDDDAKIDPLILAAQCAVLAPTLASALTKSATVSTALQRKLRNLRRLRFLTALATAAATGITSVGALIGSTPTTIAASLASFIGAIANAAAGTFVLGTDGSEAEVLALIQDLESACSFAELTMKYLIAVQSGSYPVNEAATIVTEANTRFATLVAALKLSAKYIALAAARRMST